VAGEAGGTSQEEEAETWSRVYCSCRDSDTKQTCISCQTGFVICVCLVPTDMCVL